MSSVQADDDLAGVSLEDNDDILMVHEIAAETEVTTTDNFIGNNDELPAVELEGAERVSLLGMKLPGPTTNKTTVPWFSLYTVEPNQLKADLPKDQLTLNENSQVQIHEVDLVCLGDSHTPETSEQEPSIKDPARQKRDKMKKRILRLDPAYRERERIKARERMKAKRADKTYRESERARDRMRRQMSRWQNDTLRKKEKERDRNYKKLQRYQKKAGQAENIIKQDIKFASTYKCLDV